MDKVVIYVPECGDIQIIYMSMVRTHSEYQVSIWGPYDITQIDQLEVVQERPTKMVPQIRGRPYQDTLQI